MREEARAFAARVRQVAGLLRAVDERTAARPLAPGKWSRKELVGHLIDSASNNHQRFVRAQHRDVLVFPAYDQDLWVATQRYAEAPWGELVDLFESFNLHLARVMETAPDDVLLRLRTEHNLDRIAWEAVPADEPATLGWFMRDYVDHFEHHVRQLGVE